MYVGCADLFLLSGRNYLQSDLPEQTCRAGREIPSYLFAYQLCDYCQPLGDLFFLPPFLIVNICQAYFHSNTSQTSLTVIINELWLFMISLK